MTVVAEISVPAAEFAFGKALTAVADLAVVVAAAHDGDSSASVTPDRRLQAAVELRHGHLPKLADDGFVEWDRDEGTVSLTNE